MTDVELGEGEARKAEEISDVPSNSNLNPRGGKSDNHEHQFEVEISDNEGARTSAIESVNHITNASSDSDNGTMLIAIAEIKKNSKKNESYLEQCRICHDLSEEALMDLGCGCRGELATAHKSCIELWFESRGSNKCEICQQIAANIPSPKSRPGKNYWIMRVDQVYGGLEARNPDNERGGYCPVWFALCILIGGLLLDVFVSLSLGVSALPVNIIIGALILLGLGTALRLGMRCHGEWRTRRILQRRALTSDPPPS